MSAERNAGHKGNVRDDVRSATRPSRALSREVHLALVAVLREQLDAWLTSSQETTPTGPGAAESVERRETPPSAEPLVVIADKDSGWGHLLAARLCGVGLQPRSVHIYSSSAEVVAAARVHPFAFALVDLDLPDLDGPATARALLDASASVVVVGCASVYSADVVSAFLSAGAAACIPKDAVEAELDWLVRRWVRHGLPRPSTDEQ